MNALYFAEQLLKYVLNIIFHRNFKKPQYEYLQLEKIFRWSFRGKYELKLI